MMKYEQSLLIHHASHQYSTHADSNNQ